MLYAIIPSKSGGFFLFIEEEATGRRVAAVKAATRRIAAEALQAFAATHRVPGGLRNVLPR